MTPPVLTLAEPDLDSQPSASLRRECQALVTVARCGRDRGLAAVSIIGGEAAGGEHFIPFALREKASARGRDFTYAGLAAALDRLRSLNVRRALIQIDDAQLAAELERRVEPHPDLALLYITVGCKLNQFAGAKVIGVAHERLAALREKAKNVAAAMKRRSAA